ncbi:MAG: hypothetical protein KDK36_04050 [Leptospiraceae bacterium]|nr:hypothetical protein [Leptospiraceae bacterium]
MKNYPSRLIPENNFNLIKIDNSNYSDFLCRRIQKSYTDNISQILKNSNSFIFERNGSFTIESAGKLIESDKIKDLSINKIPPSETEDIFFIIKKQELNKYINPGDKIIQLTEDDYDYNDIENFYVKIKIEEIFQFDKQVSFENETLEIDLELVHKPTHCNYSHFEFKIFLNNECITEKELKKSKRKFILSSIRSIFFKFAKLSKEFLNAYDKKI